MTPAISIVVTSSAPISCGEIRKLMEESDAPPLSVCI